MRIRWSTDCITDPLDFVKNLKIYNRSTRPHMLTYSKNIGMVDLLICNIDSYEKHFQVKHSVRTFLVIDLAIESTWLLYFKSV